MRKVKQSQISWSLVLLFSLALCFPVFAGGSFFDTIQGADEEGKTEAQIVPHNRLLKAIEGIPDGSVSQKRLSPTTSKVIFGKTQIRLVVSQAIQNISTKVSGLTFGTKILTYFIPQGTGKVYVPARKSSPKIYISSTGGNHGTPGDPTKPPSASGTLSVKDEIKKRFGIDTIDGDTKWDDNLLAQYKGILEKLPEGFRRFTLRAKRDKMYPGNALVLGYVRNRQPEVTILDRAVNSGKFSSTMVHEMTHCFQNANLGIFAQWKHTFWATGRPVPPSVSSYGNTQDQEDMAESTSFYFNNPGLMRVIQKERYEFIKKNIMGGKEF